MKVKGLLAAVLSAGLLVSTSSFAERSFNLATPVVVLMPHVMPNAMLLEISPEQAPQIRQIANVMTAERESNEIMTRELRKELWELTSRYETDPAAQQELIKLIAEAEKRRVEMSIECAAQLRQILSPEQWDLLVELAADVQ
ncbi:Spy/CpxP family protein refolding chaperone [Thiomicrospira microaerophila]|uniref:Spy/CpxP family protein refolding chaperone n=1 Tax=Thiomicrospira microaerophila TaxID=406020 RepID=UPI00200C9D79|nr:Spy/CpxP family protein refolding chaperone [Thiomicrospira microaerophila]UQB42988.1 Spy/CpxP family protein refolding chaperone [Thiomicrospira microaerophila]